LLNCNAFFCAVAWHPAQGRVVPETFTHGSAERRQRWFQGGFDGGRLEVRDTFAAGPQL
jgi:predicted metalloprotease